MGGELRRSSSVVPVDLPFGARVEVVRGHEPVRLASLVPAPFADRLVRKFELPVDGWRGASARRRELERRGRDDS